uniref:Sphingomyelin synthase-like domain-containing protein n=1 Tax=Romanomermis culicivorax TaxID=13658 RepID=A0A915KZY5_ROMCU
MVVVVDSENENDNVNDEMTTMLVRESSSNFASINGNDSKEGDVGVCLPLLPDDPSTGNAWDYQWNDVEEPEPTIFPVYPVERYKTVLAFCLMFCCTCFNGAVAALITDLVPRTPMPDVVFKFVPEQKWAWQVSDTLTMLLSLTHIIVVLIHKHRWIMARRFCLISSQLYLLRGVCMGVTWMAVPGKYHASRCVQPASIEEYWSTVIIRVSRFMLSLGLSAGTEGDEILCGDLLYSGHTLMLVLTWYSIDIHVPLKKCRPLRLAACMVTFSGMIFIVMCRMHYTVDVLLAFMLTTVYFFAYYAYLLIFRHKFWRGYALTAFWLLPLVEYFEENVPKTKLPRVLEWPFDRPKAIKKFVKQLNN